MTRSRPAFGSSMHLGRVARLAAAIALGACQDQAREVTSPPTPPSEAAVILQRANATAAVAAPVTAKQFNDANPMGWTGRAHNAFVKEYLRELRRGRIDRCVLIERIYLGGKYLGSDSARVSLAQRHATLPDLRRGAGCLARTAADSPRESEPALFRVSATNVALMSGDPTPFIAAVLLAIDSASSSTALASTVAAIVSQAEGTLSGNELDAVYTTASVGVSSAEYWESNVTSEYEAIEPSIQNGCFTQDGNHKPCEYESSFRDRTPRGQPPFVKLVSWKTVAIQDCSDILNPWAIAKVDGGVASVTFLYTWNPIAALAAGTAASATYFVVQAMLFFACVLLQ